MDGECSLMTQSLVPYANGQMYGTFNIAGCLFALLIPETKGVALEDMDILFGVVDKPSSQVEEGDEEARIRKE